MAASLAGACAVGPDFKPPAPPATESYVAGPPPTILGGESGSGTPVQTLEKGARVPTQWWTLFRNPALDRLVGDALDRSPTLVQARARLVQAREDLQATTGATRYPTVDAQIGAARQKVDPAAFGIPNVPSTGPFTLYNAQVSVSYTLDLFGGNGRVLEALTEQVNYAAHELDAARATLAANVVTAAIRRAQLRDEIQATERSLETERQTLGIVMEQHRVGGASLIDAQTERNRYAELEASLAPLRTRLAQVEHQLAVYNGSPPALAVLPEMSLADLSLPTTIPLTVPSDLVRRRPDVLAAEALWHQASANVGVATSHLWPQLTITGNAGTERSQPGELADGVNVWSIGARLLQPIFHGGELRSRRRSAVAAHDAAAAAYEEVVLEALQQVADCLKALDGDAQIVKARRDVAVLTDSNYRIAQTRFDAGGISQRELLDSERQQIQSEIERGRAEADRYTQTVALLQALGGGW